MIFVEEKLQQPALLSRHATSFVYLYNVYIFESRSGYMDQLSLVSPSPFYRLAGQSCDREIDKF